jgi:hypothetical protein
MMAHNNRRGPFVQLAISVGTAKAPQEKLQKLK